MKELESEKVYKEKETNIEEFKILEENSLKCLMKDIGTYEHNLRVKEYCLMIGLSLNLDASELNFLGIAAEYHDIGKIELRDEVLLKKDKLTAEEYESIKKHTEYGYEIIRNLVDERIALGVKHHHERINGSGYPEGLKGDEISYIAKIIAIADAYDAMTTDRPYHNKISEQKAMEELMKHRGVLFEAEYVDIFQNWLIESGFSL